MGKSYTLNFDGYLNQECKRSGAGCAIFDNEGKLVVFAYYNLTNNTTVNDIGIAELIALKNGLTLAKMFNINLNLIKGDTKQVIESVQKGGPFSPLVGEIRAILCDLNLDPMSKIKLVDEEANKTAVKFAYLGSMLEKGCVIYATEGDFRAVEAETVATTTTTTETAAPSSGGSSMATRVGMLARGVGCVVSCCGSGAMRVVKAPSGIVSSFFRKDTNKANVEDLMDSKPKLSLSSVIGETESKSIEHNPEPEPKSKLELPLSTIFGETNSIEHNPEPEPEPEPVSNLELPLSSISGETKSIDQATEVEPEPEQGPERESKTMRERVITGVAVAAGVAVVAWGAYSLVSGNGVKVKALKNASIAVKSCYNYFFSKEDDPNSYHILSFDGIDSNQLNEAAAGCVIRNNLGDVVAAASYNLNDECYNPDCNIAMAAAMALKKGLDLSRQYNITPDLIVGDNQEVIDRILGCHPNPPKLSKMTDIVNEIRNAIDVKSQLRFIAGTANSVAGGFATLGRKLHQGYKIYGRGAEALPSGLANIVEAEKITGIFK